MINFARMNRFSKVLSNILLLAATVSCSTTRVLQEGEYRLATVDVKVLNDKEFNESELLTYVKQKPNSNFIFGWSPGLNIYNWQNGKGNGWDRFVKKIGVAPVIYDPELVDKSIENVGRHLEYIGYYGSEISSQIRVKRRNVHIVYTIDLGKTYRLEDIRYHLPDNSDFSETFSKDIHNSTLKSGNILSEASLETESVRSSNFIRNNGFYDFNKNYFFFSADTLRADGTADLDVTINEYTRNETEKEAKPLRQYQIGKVTMTYPNSLKIRRKVLEELNTVKTGELYSDEDISNTYSRLTSLRMFSSVNIVTAAADSNKVDCSIQLVQSKLQGFKINIEGSVNSTGLFGVSPQLSYYHKNVFHGGEWLNLSFMGNFQMQFKNKIRAHEFGVSSSLSFPKFLFLPYELFKGPSIPRTDINLSYNYQDRPEYTRNIISTSFGFSGSKGPRFFYQAYPVQLSIVHVNKMSSSFLESLHNDPFLYNAYQDHFDLGAGGTFYYTTNTDVNPKTSYSYIRLQTDIAGNLLSAFKGLMEKDSNGAGIIWNTPYSQYVRGELTLGRTWRFGKKDGQAIATRFVAGAGYAYGNSEALPFEKHFYAGGANSLRGWQARSVGPGCAEKDGTFKIPNQTGDMKLEANVEYRFPLFWKFASAVFFDAGNVWTLRASERAASSLDYYGGHGLSPSEKFDYDIMKDPDVAPRNKESKFTWMNFGRSLAFNWGLGLRLDLDFLVLRVDWGMKLHDPARAEGEKWLNPKLWFNRDGYAIHFGVGYPF